MSASYWTRRAAECGLAIGFLTRIPLRSSWLSGRDGLASAVWSFPIVGAIVGGCGGIVFAACVMAGLSAWLAGTLAVMAQILLTGGLHEDGLADSADGLGGQDRERRLAIMRDSRIGSYGVMALLIALAIRVGALAALADPWQGATALLLSGVLSRAAMGWLMLLERPARIDGLGAGAGRPVPTQVLVAWLFGAGLGLTLTGLLPLAMALAAVLSATWLTASLARRRLGGHTGDVLGACQQVAECICLLLLSTALFG